MKVILTSIAVLLTAQISQARLGETRDQSEARYGLPKSERTQKGETPLLEGARELTFHHQGFKIRCALLLATDGQEYVVREEYSKLEGHPAIKDLERDAILEAEKSGVNWTFKKLAAITEQDLRKPAKVEVETQMTSQTTKPAPTGVLEEPKPAPVVEKKFTGRRARVRPARPAPATPVAPKAPAIIPAAPSVPVVVPFEQSRTPASPFVLAGAAQTWARPDGATASHFHGGYPVRLDLPQAAKYEVSLLASKAKEERAGLPRF